MRVSVVGLGRLGAPLAAILADTGARVIGADCDAGLVARLRQGQFPSLEPELAGLLTGAADRMEFTTDTAAAVAQTEVSLILVPTPSTSEGDYSNDYLLAAIAETGAAISHKAGRHLVVVVSTVMPGTMAGLITPALEAAAGRRLGPLLGLCYCPEFVALGDVVANMRQPDMVLIGQSDEASGAQLLSLLRPVWTREPAVWQLNFVNAELAKIAVNAYVTTKISCANLLSEICEALPGADAAAVTSVMGSDRRIGASYLKPGLGYAGPCFPRDNIAMSVLARRAGLTADIADATDAVNRRQAGRIVDRVRSLAGSGTVGVLGLAYKPGSDVVEASQGLEIATRLSALGYRVVVHDPAARPQLPEAISWAGDADECARACDVLVIATPWPVYGQLAASALERSGRRLAIVDCWRMPELLAHSGRVDLVYPGVATS